MLEELIDPDLNETPIDMAFKLSKALRKSCESLTIRDARWLVDVYYTIQNDRIRSAAQLRESSKSGEPHEVIQWAFTAMNTFEGGIRAALGRFAKRFRVGQWLQAQCGIGPVLSAAMLTNFDIRKSKTCAGFWRFAGLDPTLEWKKGQKRPYNARLKTICTYKLGECFVKTCNNEKGFYGKLYAAKKLEYAAKNDAGGFSEKAASEIESKGSKMQKTQRIEHWKQGKIAPAHVHDMSRRWAVKMFISHLHEVMHWDWYNAAPPAPYIIEHPGDANHRHLVIAPGPNLHTLDGLPLSSLLTEPIVVPSNHKPTGVADDAKNASVDECID